MPARIGKGAVNMSERLPRLLPRDVRPPDGGLVGAASTHLERLQLLV
ncbi:MAG: hypothetical protein ABGY24_11225 [bacterium]